MRVIEVWALRPLEPWLLAYAALPCNLVPDQTTLQFDTNNLILFELYLSIRLLSPHQPVQVHGQDRAFLYTNGRSKAFMFGACWAQVLLDWYDALMTKH